MEAVGGSVVEKLGDRVSSLERERDLLVDLLACGEREKESVGVDMVYVDAVCACDVVGLPVGWCDTLSVADGVASRLGVSEVAVGVGTKD